MHQKIELLGALNFIRYFCSDQQHRVKLYCNQNFTNFLNWLQNQKVLYDLVWVTRKADKFEKIREQSGSRSLLNLQQTEWSVILLIMWCLFKISGGHASKYIIPFLNPNFSDILDAFYWGNLRMAFVCLVKKLLRWT